MAMLGNTMIDFFCQRPHSMIDSIHGAELNAGSSAIHRAIPLIEFCHELGIRQLAPVPLFTDSQSVIYVARDTGAAKRSIWLQRRVAVMQEAVALQQIAPTHIDGTLNVADILTKYVAHPTWIRMMRYILNDIEEDGSDEP